MINHTHQCVFVHIPKTGGTSIEHALGGLTDVVWGAQDHRTITQHWPTSTLDIALVARNRPGRALRMLRGDRDRPVLSRRQRRSYFSFAFVRNPWARAWSWHADVMRNPQQLEAVNLTGPVGFDEFLDRDLGAWALRSQLVWLTDRNGDIAVDFVGRFENLADDFEHVARRLGAPDLSLPHLLATPNSTSHLAMSGFARDLIAERHGAEIETFRYRFDERAGHGSDSR